MPAQGGLVNASLQSVPGASRYYHGGANIYGKLGYKLYPPALREALAAGAGKGGTSLGNGSKSNYRTEENYQASKVGCPHAHRVGADGVTQCDAVPIRCVRCRSPPRHCTSATSGASHPDNRRAHERLHGVQLVHRGKRSHRPDV